MIRREAPAIQDVQQVLTECLHSTDFTVERERSGVSTYVYRVHAAGQVLYLRVLPEQGMSFVVEVQLHQLLRLKGVQVPEVLHFEHRNEVLGMSMMVVTEIAGSDASRCDSADQYKHLLREAGHQLALLNQVDVDGFGWVVRDNTSLDKKLHGEKRSLHEVIFENLDEDLSGLAGHVFHPEEAARIRQLLDSGTELMTRHAPKLAHGDFDDSHIFQQDGQYSGIIDFGEIQGSSPFYDLGHFKLHDGQRYQGFEALTAGYHDVRMLTRDDHAEIDLWALWIGVRRLGMIHGRPLGGYHEHLSRTVKQLLTHMKPMK
ncbi:phosphotransferase family protein [Paenibacillus guangzhouensis]|uniref:phosphotransferase family protein n=1 Tax=Paenibacillus guangzhouensis TaxID=1473112 RepID=UPI00187B9AD0|nr:aminoglycoside phosphotransferase family protein [Paenibacillus guangzhouensis]